MSKNAAFGTGKTHRYAGSGVKGEREEAMSFAENLEQLDELLRRLESDSMSLDEALETFEQGVVLLRESRRILERAEQRVTLLTEDGEAPFEDQRDAQEKSEN